MRETRRPKSSLPSVMSFGVILYIFIREMGLPVDSAWFGGALFMLFMILGAGVMVYIRLTGNVEGDEWNALRSAFSDSRPAGQSRYNANGTLRLDEFESLQIRIALFSDGIRLVRHNRLTSAEEAAFIPWARIKGIDVLEPRRLNKCRSFEDRQKIAARLSAELTISRGDFPSFTISVPWRDEFRSALPGNIALRQSWHWPAISEFVYH